MAWDISLDNARARNFTPSLTERSTQMLEASKKLRDHIFSFEENIISFSNELLTLKSRIDILNTKLEELELHYEMIYLSKTHPAIWERDTMPADTNMSIPYVISEIIQTYSRGLGSFYENYRIRIWINLFLFILLLIISFIVRRNIRLGQIRSNDLNIQTFFKIFERPVSISLILALFLLLMLYPDASVVVRDVAVFLIVIPLVIISLIVLPRFWHPLLIVTSLLFYFEEILETLRFESFRLPGFLLLVITLLTLAFVA